ncbi:MAG: hypothetical protein FWC43_06805, partial [Planctomycetaceae bacterium]|nr:hypothetical protein [Planctomycetaceae bacterium]
MPYDCFESPFVYGLSINGNRKRSNRINSRSRRARTKYGTQSVNEMVMKLEKVLKFKGIGNRESEIGGSFSLI